VLQQKKNKFIDSIKSLVNYSTCLRYKIPALIYKIKWLNKSMITFAMQFDGIANSPWTSHFDKIVFVFICLGWKLVCENKPTPFFYKI
jgi:hypothetical protein